MGTQVQERDKVSVVVGVDGAGRTHRLDAIAAGAEIPVVRFGAPGVPIALAEEQLRAAVAAQTRLLVTVDDPHRLEGRILAELAEAARSGLPIVLARRPAIEQDELVELDEAVAAQGGVEVLRALDLRQIGQLVTAVTGRACSTQVATTVLDASAGLPALAVAVIAALVDPAAGALEARLQRRLARLTPPLVQVARVLALRLEIADDALALACGLASPDLEVGLRVLRDEGLLVPGGEQMIPAVAEALLAELAPGHRRRIHDDVARAFLATGAAPIVTATQLRAARARGASAAAAYLTAGEQLRFSDPESAAGWYDDAQEAGAPATATAAGRAEIAVLLGLRHDADAVGSSTMDTGRLGLVAGAVAAFQGRAERAGTALLSAVPPGPVLAVPALIATGRVGPATTAAGQPAAVALRLLADAALACPDPAIALPLAIEAIEAAEQKPPATVLPDTPHALGAVLAVMTGDVATAVNFLERALSCGIGGPAAADRHWLLLAWARLRAGRSDTAHEQLRRLAGTDLGGRDRVLYAAVSVGLARRSGDIATLRTAWPEVERVLARQSLDLFQLEAAEEFAVTAARLRRSQRVAPTLARFAAMVQDLGSPPAWEITLGWLHLQVAVATDDSVGARAAVQRINAGTPAGDRQLAQQVAASVWSSSLAGSVDPEAVLAACDRLATAELPWEASRLAGHAAIRVPDAAAARRLLERARDLTALVVRTLDRAQQAGLSEREVDVARLVLAGRTHREIGAQLFIAPKTVEHHVARIRTKLGVTNRADFVFALREIFGSESAPEEPP